MTALALRNDLDGLLDRIREATDVEDLTEARARVGALRAWAKAHSLAKQMRLELLKIEVESLVRIVDLGGIEKLPKADRRAAKFLHSLTPIQRAAFVADSGLASTAVGLCRTFWSRQEDDEHAEMVKARSFKAATDPGVPDESPEEVKANLRRRAMATRHVIGAILEEFLNQDSFTVTEVAEAAASYLDLALDPGMAEGLERVTRTMVTRLPDIELDSGRLPRTLTVETAEGWVRIPVENAKLWHLDNMRACRLEQIKQDQAALAELDRLSATLWRVDGANEFSRIGDLLSTPTDSDRSDSLDSEGRVDDVAG